MGAHVADSMGPDHLDAVLLDRLLKACGIGGEFIEFSGNIRTIPLAYRYRVLQAMGLAPADDEGLRELLARHEAEEYRALPAVQLVEAAAPEVWLWLTETYAKGFCRWRLEPEEGEPLEGGGCPQQWPNGEAALFGGQVWRRYALRLPPLPLGYHRLAVELDGQRWHSLLIVAPTQAWRSPKLARGERSWGLSVQLYTLRSLRNWGIGDFADLRRLTMLAAGEGADFVLLNPLHALDPRHPENASPYSPCDRRFLNPLYIAVDELEGFGDAAVQAWWRSASVRRRLRKAVEAPLVQYGDVARLKFDAFARIYAVFDAEASEQERAAFAHWRTQAGDALVQFSRFQASLAAADSVAAKEDFQAWLQWQAQCQLEACQEQALAAGMDIGLVRDLAVGSSADGCEVLSNQDQYCLDARIGAPPDSFNPDGQNWGLPPLLPAALEADEFRIFRELLCSNMRACGALRIDHVLALYRLWWCPNDGSNATGAYVHYPVDLLFAILRLESVRQRCVVIGEDLGVVPPEIRSYLENGGIYSNCVFYFEKYDNWHFRKPEHYKPQALTMQANHDVAPLTAWWNGSDLRLRRELGLIPDDAHLVQEQQWRRGERGQLLQWLDEQGLLPGHWQARPLDAPVDDALRVALTQAVARVASQLLSVQIDDLACLELPVNIPGTNSEYGNWRRKLPDPLEALFARPFVTQLLDSLREARHCNDRL
ncbi:MAG TPA: 4-alpha-glucanotransferase [Hyphomicrobiales bacterium]|nr:4-alpha-glucanotransferase [Hyphomicrobiales bacterium]